jgi:hypothetical protein
MPGDQLVRPQNAPPGVSPGVGVQPGSSSNIIRARIVILSGPGDGLFGYSPAPGFGTLVVSVTAVGGVDQYGNAYGAGFNLYGPGGANVNVSLFNNDPIIVMAPDNAITVGYVPPQISTGYFGTGPAGFFEMDLNSGNPATSTADAKVILFSSSADGVTSVANIGLYGGPSGNLIADVTQNGIAAANPSVPNTAEVWHAATLLNGWFNTAGFGGLRYQLTTLGAIWVQGTISSTDATSATFFTLPAGYVPASAGGASVGATAGAPSGNVPNVRWDTSGNLVMNNAGSFPQTTSYFIDCLIPALATGSGSISVLLPTAQLSLTAAPPSSGLSPIGIPGNWTLAFDDEFDATSGYNPAVSQPPSPLRWAQLVGYAINGTSCLGTAACSYVENNVLNMIVASATQGAYISSAPSDGAGAEGWVMPVGGCVEARIWVPGPSSTLPYNWGGYFASGQAWPTNGEGDICETNGSGIDINYHYESGGEQQSGPYNPAGNWCNSWHTYACLRGETELSFYWDGVLVHPPWTTDDAGGGWSILPCNGTGGGGPASYNNPIMVDYVRGWVPAAGGSLSYRAAPATAQSSGGVTSFGVSKQAGTVAGDFIGIHLFGAGAATVACTGFTVVQDPNDYGAFLYKTADGTEGSTFNITGLGGNSVSTVIATVAQANLDSVVGTPTSSSNSTSIAVGSINVGTNGDWVLAFVGNENGYSNVSYAITPPAGYTSQATNGAQTANPTVMLADNESASAGATGTKTYTSPSPTYWSGIMVALTPN